MPFARADVHRRSAAAITLIGGLAVTFAACDGGASGDCPETTEALPAVYEDVYRQLEVCASRVTGTTLRREELPRVAADAELVECKRNPDQRCVATPAGETVYGFYLQGCDTFTVATPEILLHEMLHPILCDAPPGDCDPAHESPVWTECQTMKGCPDGRILLIERVCDGTPDCSGGEDEMGCP